MKKIISLALAGLLLSSNAAYAQEKNLSLKDYQKQAQEDLASAPHISKEAKVLIGATGASLGLLIIQKLVHNSKMKQMSKKLEETMQELANQQEVTLTYYKNKESLVESNVSLKTQNKELQEALTKQEASLTAALQEERATITRLEKELRQSNIKKEGWKVSSATQKKKYQEAIEAANKREAQLLEELAAVRSKSARYKDHFMALARYSTDIEKELVVYEKLFDKTVGKAEKEVLLAQLKSAPWVKELTESQSKHFFKVLEDAMALSFNSPQSASYILRVGAGQAAKTIPYYERFIAMSRHLFKKQTIAVIALFSILGTTSAYAYETDTYARRITQNFDLFINASDEELAKLEQNPELRKLCIEGANLIHEMSQMSVEEVQELKRVTNATEPSSPSKTLQKFNY